MINVVTAEALTSFGTDVLTALGVPNADAHLLSDSLVTAELWGHSSHGMLRLPWYVEPAPQWRDDAGHPGRDRDRLRRGGGPSTDATESARC